MATSQLCFFFFFTWPTAWRSQRSVSSRLEIPVLAGMPDSLLQGPRKDLGGVELFDSFKGGGGGGGGCHSLNLATLTEI